MCAWQFLLLCIVFCSTAASPVLAHNAEANQSTVLRKESPPSEEEGERRVHTAVDADGVIGDDDVVPPTTDHARRGPLTREHAAPAAGLPQDVDYVPVATEQRPDVLEEARRPGSASTVDHLVPATLLRG